MMHMSINFLLSMVVFCLNNISLIECKRHPKLSKVLDRISWAIIFIEFGIIIGGILQW
jgi:hypothetical protein